MHLYDAARQRPGHAGDSLVVQLMAATRQGGYWLSTHSIDYRFDATGLLGGYYAFMLHYQPEGEEPVWRATFVEEARSTRQPVEYTFKLYEVGPANSPLSNSPRQVAQRQSMGLRQPVEQYEGLMRHRSCVGTQSVWQVLLQLEAPPPGGTGRDARQAHITFVPATHQMGNLSSSKITMQLEVYGGIAPGELMMHSTQGGNHQVSGYYLASNRYRFSMVPATDSGELSGVMQGQGTRGRLFLKKSEPRLAEKLLAEGGSVSDLIATVRQRRQAGHAPAAPGPTVAAVAQAAPAPPPPDTLPSEPDWGREEHKTYAAMESRNNDTLHVIQLKDTGVVTIALYDNALIDGDSVSLFVDDILVHHKAMLTARPLEWQIARGEAPYVVIKMFAENLGTIPPNTGIMIVSSKDKELRLPMRSDLHTNGCVIVKWE